MEPRLSENFQLFEELQRRCLCVVEAVVYDRLSDEVPDDRNNTIGTHWLLLTDVLSGTRYLAFCEWVINGNCASLVAGCSTAISYQWHENDCRCQFTGLQRWQLLLHHECLKLSILARFARTPLLSNELLYCLQLVVFTLWYLSSRVKARNMGQCPTWWPPCRM